MKHCSHRLSASFSHIKSFDSPDLPFFANNLGEKPHLQACLPILYTMATQRIPRYIRHETRKVGNPSYLLGMMLAGRRGRRTSLKAEIAAFDHDIVKAVLDGDREEAAYLAEAKIPGFDAYRAKDLTVVWV